MRKTIIVLLVLILAAPLVLRLALATVLLPVDRSQFVYMTQFGKHIATYDGSREEDAGLHVRWPWPIQSPYIVDRRLQSFDLPETELLTHDPRRNTIDRTLTMVAYVCWRIPDADAVDCFIRRVGSPDRARSLLSQRISSQLGAVVGQMEMDDLISIEPGRVDRTLNDLRQKLMGGVTGPARQEYGIEVVDVRLRRHSYPQAVRSAIFERITSERNKKVAEYQSDGDQMAANIRSEAERDARQIVADARATEQKLKGHADAEADRIRNEAHTKDPEFYAFLKKLEEYQRILADNQTVLLLSSHREVFDLLFNPPKMNGTPGASKSSPEKIGANPPK